MINFQRKLQMLSIVLLASVLMLNNCTKKQKFTQDILAFVNGKPITLSEFYNVIPKRSFLSLSKDKREKRFNVFIDDIVVAAAAKEIGLENDPEYKSRLEDYAKRQLNSTLYEKVIVGEILTDEALKDLYEKNSVKIRASHILISFKNSQGAKSNRSEKEAKELADDLIKRIRNGENFESLARQFSEDPSSAKNGGDLGYITIGKMVKPFEDAAFSLEVNQISEPVKTIYGYHIIKVSDRIVSKQEPFEKTKSKLISIGRRYYSKQIKERAEQFIENKKREAGFSLNDRAIGSFIEAYNKTLNELQTTPNKTLSPSEVLDQMKWNEVMGKFKDQNIDLNWMKNLMEKYKDRRLPPLTDVEPVRRIIESEIINTIIQTAAEEMNIRETPEFKEKMKKYQRGILKDVYINKEIYGKIDPSEEEIRNYYDKYKDVRFKSAEKVRIQEIWVTDQQLANKLLEQIKSGEDFSKLAKEYTERKSAKETGGILKPFTKNRWGAMGKKAFQLNVGEIAGPIQQGTGWSIIKLVEKIPETPEKFSKVKERARNQLIQELRKNAKEKHIKELRKKYNTSINYRLLDTLVSQT
jgi:parvulin-like peptidyl-prolyl isomerase